MSEFAAENSPESLDVPRAEADTPSPGVAARGVLVRDSTKLRTCDDIRLEMGKVYRRASRGQLDTKKAASLIYMLSEIRRCIESDTIAKRQEAIVRMVEELKLRGVNVPQLPFIGSLVGTDS